ncbi:MAG: hypothetical protein LBJ21_02130, partial [Acidobacteriota bacterium]|nr:hypothetical protein [Acidobacteriota bacterium]
MATAFPNPPDRDNTRKPKPICSKGKAIAVEKTFDTDTCPMEMITQRAASIPNIQCKVLYFMIAS